MNAAPANAQPADAPAASFVTAPVTFVTAPVSFAPPNEVLASPA